MQQSITLKIAGKTFSLKASSPQMEQLMRMAASDVNAMLEKFDIKFPDRTLEDKLSFVALQMAVSKFSAQQKVESASQEAQQLCQQLAVYLKGETE